MKNVYLIGIVSALIVLSAVTGIYAYGIMSGAGYFRNMHQMMGNINTHWTTQMHDYMTGFASNSTVRAGMNEIHNLWFNPVRIN
jgi:hypothetical protein